METITIKELLDRCDFDPIDLIQIDTEGFDHVIVKLILGLAPLQRPKAINFEHKHIPPVSIEGLFRKLAKSGYLWTNCDWDTFCEQGCFNNNQDSF